mgnify:CR=1 FL=1
MIKTKATDAGKVGGNYPTPAPLADTTRTRVGGTMPATAPLPTMADQMPYLTAAPASVATPDSGPVAESLPLFNASTGYTDTGAQSTGDLGGAA